MAAARLAAVIAAASLSLILSGCGGPQDNDAPWYHDGTGIYRCCSGQYMAGTGVADEGGIYG